MKKEWEMLMNQMDFDTQTLGQAKDLVAIKQNKIQKFQIQRTRQWERSLKKKQLYQAAMLGITRAQAEKESMEMLYSSMSVLGLEDFAEMQNRWAEVADYRSVLEAEVVQINDVELFEQWLEIQQGEVLINFLEELQASMDLK